MMEVIVWGGGGEEDEAADRVFRPYIYILRKPLIVLLRKTLFFSFHPRLFLLLRAEYSFDPQLIKIAQRFSTYF